MTRIKLSDNFYLDEFTRSQTAARAGIDIVVDRNSDEFENLTHLCEFVLQPIRNALGPIHITSGYRSLELNALIGGSGRSQHCYGLAADFVVSGHTPLQVCRYIKESNLYHLVDQCIHEFGQWTHVSIASGSKPRQDYLTAYKDGGKTRYQRGIHAIEDLRGVA